RSKPSSAIPTPPGKRAASRMPSAGCAASCRARPTSQPSQPVAFAVSLPLTTTPRANALTSARPPSPLLNCCTSSVNPPPAHSLHDGLLLHQLIVHPPAAGSLDQIVVTRREVPRGIADEAPDQTAHFFRRDPIGNRERQEIRRHDRNNVASEQIDEFKARIALVDMMDDEVRLVIEQPLPRTGNRLEMQVQMRRGAAIEELA